MAAIAALLTLAACGVEGPPQPPPATQGIAISGDARIGVTGQF